MEIKVCFHIHRPPKFYDTDKDMQLKLNVSAQAGTAGKTKQRPDGKSRLRRTAVFQAANCRRAKAEDLAKRRKWMILTAKRLRQNETKCRRQNLPGMHVWQNHRRQRVTISPSESEKFRNPFHGVRERNLLNGIVRCAGAIACFLRALIKKQGALFGRWRYKSHLILGMARDL